MLGLSGNQTEAGQRVPLPSRMMTRSSQVQNETLGAYVEAGVSVSTEPCVLEAYIRTICGGPRQRLANNFYHGLTQSFWSTDHTLSSTWGVELESIQVPLNRRLMTLESGHIGLSPVYCHGEGYRCCALWLFHSRNSARVK